MNSCIIFNVPNDNEFIRNLGAYRIAQYLRTKNWDAEVVDFTTAWSLDELKELFKTRHTDSLKFVGISQLFVFWNVVLEEFFSWIKLEYPDVIIIFGSQGFPTFKTHSIDYYIKGFGENGLVALLEFLFSNGPSPKISLEYPDKRIILANSFYAAGQETNLITLYEDRDFIQPGEWLMIETARGCKFSCDFCTYPFLNAKGNYTRDSEGFRLQLVDAYDRFGVTDYICADSTFNDSTNRIIQYADVVETLDFTPWFSGYIRHDLLISRPDDKEHLLRMNFLGHSYGVETLNRETGKSIKKGMDPEKVKQGLIDIKSYFLNNGRKLYRSHINLISGLPYETKESLEETISWMTKNMSDQSVSMWPLSINLNITDNASSIAIDYKKYGYRKYKQTDVNLLRNVDSSVDQLIWENDYMNIVEASEIACNCRKKSNQGYLDCWLLGANYLKDLKVDERLKITEDTFYTNDRTISHSSFIKNYINKKISWSPNK